jgi:DNA ligase (NAD+)
VEIRGEVVIGQSTLKTLNDELEATGQKPYASTRNLAAGTLKLGNLEEVRRRRLLFRPWDVILPHGALPDSGVERLKDIVALGFAASDDRIVTNREELSAAIEEMLVILQEPGAEIGMDGIVIKVDSHKLREKLGRGSKFTNYQVCFKPQNQKAETILRGVEWQVGRQGKITPVAIVEPVTLGGVQIARATLNNYTWLSALGVRIGSRVALVRSGDVIPKITEVLEQPDDSIEIEAPTRCPDCGSPVAVSSEEDSTVAIHYCDSDICPGRICDLLTYIADRTVLEIDGLGPELAGKLIASGTVKSLTTALSDLFQFQREIKTMMAPASGKAVALLLEKGFPVVLTLRMVESIDRAKTAPWPVWIAAMAIPMIGRRLGKVLATKLQLQPEDLPALPAKFAAIQLGGIEGLGVSKLGELQRYAVNPAWIHLCSVLYEEGVRPVAIVSATSGGPKPLDGVSFVLTGEFDAIGPRDHITALLEARGAVAKSGVSKNVTHLIVGAAPGKSKLTKAEQLGIPQVGVSWLIDALAG